MFKKATTENAAARARIFNALCAVSPDQGINFDQINTAAGPEFDVRNGAKHLLQWAVKQAERATGCPFVSVRGVGIKRLPTNQAVEVGASGLVKTGRAAKRTYDRLKAIGGTGNELDPHTRGILSVQMGVCGAIKTIANPKSFDKLKAAVLKPGAVAKPIPPKSVLDHFRKK